MNIGQAVVEGGPRRPRPSVMTALATTFALVGVIIGGPISSTLLTLVLIPTL
ncbi:hypothetical protein [Streptomyces sp. NPDC050548]|uniref:hypothetical protein n=1 Tax=Streptomyces sp. NPDC050548 TaxID=3365629 RepID=UPI0037A83756